MPKLVSTTSSGVAGKAFIVAALSTVCTAWLSHQLPKPGDDVSLHASDDMPEQAARRASVPAVAQLPTPAPAPVVQPAVPAYRVETVQVKHSFSEAADQMGINAAITAKLAHALEGRIDFRHDLRPGSEVRFVFRNGTTQVAASAAAASSASAATVADATTGSAANADATPVAMRISTGKESHDLFLYRNLDGKAFYYRADGRPAAPTFLRYPVNFTRVSSEFSPERLDPVTHRWAAHEGVDLAAPIGTPIHATAQGTVTFAGWELGYGRVIKIKNFGEYSTTFAHLSRFAKSLRAGAQVKQGQVIGYVGKTGWATGPHLHYEVHVDNVPQDPLTVDLPVRTALDGADKEHFAQQVQKLTPML
ncbi:peptidoglycan DD-metalloendopeptidase family protein [Paraburkholderia sp. Ac-20340]|uniref:peptidoglycan DD-metalloendopeptidase family protein n=1 Tax=Paraburkholderia sp. Ac-20340 TaxID=2703888 RepID=UPI001F121A7D|nr:peptidoglycan DD-metalloendopeptidase family protein [Paraburkholderia sp. Ac-20340]